MTRSMAKGAWVTTLLIILTFACLCGCVHVTAPHAANYPMNVSFPDISLSEGERIEAIEVVITCGRFASIRHIPDDWSVEVVSPVSEVSTLKAEAGHGSSALWSSHALKDFITISNCSSSCFSIKGTASLSTADKERKISFTQADFKMRPRR